MTYHDLAGIEAIVVAQILALAAVGVATYFLIGLALPKPKTLTFKRDFTHCPACGNDKFFEGPHGGMSINVLCSKCCMTWCWMGPFGWEPIANSLAAYKSGDPQKIEEFA